MGALPKKRLSVDEFIRWWGAEGDDARFELIDGMVVAMGRDTIRHNLAKLRAVNALRDAIRRAGVNCTALTDGVGVYCDATNFRLPDALVDCGTLDPESSMADKPVIIVEIVSPSSENRDVHEKMRDYFAIDSVVHYLIVYESRDYLVHHRRTDAGPIETTFVTSGDIRLSPPGITINAQDVFTEAE